MPMRRTHLKRIVVDPKVMLGKPVIRGTRITVELILEKLAADISIDEILADYPRLTRADVLAAIEYARHAVTADEVIPTPPRADEIPGRRERRGQYRRTAPRGGSRRALHQPKRRPACPTSSFSSRPRPSAACC
jgi:uncharacterized protein (DUF433 family)